VDLQTEQDNGTELGTKLTVKPYCKNKHMLREEKCELKDTLRGARRG